jgi:hypothetical protein
MRPSQIVINRLGNGLKFLSANSNRIDIPSTSLLNFQYNTNFSIALSALISDNASQFIISKQNGTTNYKGWGLFISSLKTIDFFLSSSITPSFVFYRTFSLPNGFRLGSLVHITLIKSGVSITDMNCYVNGNLCPAANNISSLSSTSIDYTSTGERIGARATTTTTHDSYLNSSVIYNLKIINRAITTPEMMKLVGSDNASRPRTITNSEYILDYAFDEKSGTTLSDASTNALNATLVNFVNTSLGINNQWVDNLQQPITS